MMIVTINNHYYSIIYIYIKSCLIKQDLTQIKAGLKVLRFWWCENVPVPLRLKDGNLGINIQIISCKPKMAKG